MLDREQFLAAIRTDGCTIVHDVLDPSFIERAKRELADAIRREVQYHGTPDYSDYGMVMICSIYGGSFIELFDNPRLIAPFNAVLGEGCIVYAYTSSSMPPGGTNYSRRLHCDSPRVIPGYITNLGATIALDDFTEESGATYYLPRSHDLTDPPAEDRFYRDAQRVLMPAGSVWYFHARTWHAGGINHTNGWRHALTINMCRPYMKQRIDIPRAMADMDLSGASEQALQKLGFYAQTPASLEEYYAPPDKRKFRQKTE